MLSKIRDQTGQTDRHTHKDRQIDRRMWPNALPRRIRDFIIEASNFCYELFHLDVFCCSKSIFDKLFPDVATVHQ